MRCKTRGVSSSGRPPVFPAHAGAAGASGPPSAGAGPGAFSLPPTSATTCMLLIGDRVVLRANAPPEAEYILFEIADIELRSSEPGRVREHGYQTTVERARARLRAVGATAALARDCATAMHPVLSRAYARGAAAKHVAPYLSPLELFQAEHYDAASHTYRGVFIDLPLIVADLCRPDRGGRAPGALPRVAARGARRTRRPSSSRRRRGRSSASPASARTDAPTSSALRDIRTMLSRPRRPFDPRRTFASSCRVPTSSPSFVRGASRRRDDDARALYSSLERAIAVRDIPERGPLADPDAVGHRDAPRHRGLRRDPRGTSRRSSARAVAPRARRIYALAPR